MDYFDTLPVHFQPQPLESLCSYLTRLAEANGVGRVRRLYHLIYPGQKRNTGYISDLPPLSFGVLPDIAVCSEDQLRATTFYYLGQRLAGQIAPIFFGHFLASSVARFHRYCPRCLAEHGYFFLPWRFLLLPGCPEHECYLLDQCGHCGMPVPLFSTPPHFAHCPHCETSLTTCTSAALSAVDLEISRVRFHDLAALSSLPDGYELDIPTQLAIHREAQRIPLTEMARLLGISPPSVKSMENPHNREKKPAFQYYVDYVAILALTLRDLFCPPPNEPDWPQHVNRITTLHRERLNIQAHEREKLVLARAEVAIEELWASGERATIHALAKRMGTNTVDLQVYPSVCTLLADLKVRREQRWWQQRADEFMALIQSKVEQSPTDLHPLSLRTISRQLGVARGTIRRHPKVYQYVQDLVEESRHFHRLRVKRLVSQLKTTATRLRRAGQPVTEETLQAAGISLADCDWSPRTQRLLKTLTQPPEAGADER